MFKLYKGYITLFSAGLILFSACVSSCKKYLDVGSPASELTKDKVFVDSATTLSSVLSLYSYRYTKGYILSLNTLGPMSADEGYYFNNATYTQYKTNTLTSGNLGTPVFANAYSIINIANYNIEGLSATTSLTPIFKNQLLGECKFWRAFCYFNLTNYFGKVPLVTSSDASVSKSLPRSEVSAIYAQIMGDLTSADSLLSGTFADYSIRDKARVNKYAVAALLARTYLYQGNWAAAEAAASRLIGSGIYSLEDFDHSFLETSKETIWQVQNNYNSAVTGVTAMGILFVPVNVAPAYVLYDTLVNTFEGGDLRKKNWTNTITYSGATYYYPYKYKNNKVTTSGNEYNVLFRLAEMYLIRSEARAMQNNISGAQDDINAIRTRAGLGNTTASTQADMLAALEHERWVELFTEWSDRWFNLRRTNRIDAVLSKEKLDWQPFQALYPVPLDDIKANRNLLPNNPGY